VNPVTLQVQQGPNQPPLASFTVTPNPVVPEGQVTYDGSESMDPAGGEIVKYEWDRNGDGTYELDTGSSPTLTEMEPGQGFPGHYTVGLRVTDGDGATGTTTREVIVEHPSPRVASAVKLAPRIPEAETHDVSPRLRQVDPGELQINGDELIVQARMDRGRLPGSAFPAKLRRGKRWVRWKSSTDAVIDTKENAGTARGVALLSFPAGGRACMAFRVDSPPGRKADGAFRVLGGVARASGLRGRGVGEGKVTADGIVIDGRFDLDFGGKRNFRLGKSDCAPLLRQTR
jgi:PKD domain